LSTIERIQLPGLGAIARHALPNVVVSTIVPSALFYVGWYTQGRSAAFALALGWAFTMLAWRAVRKQRMPALLLLTTTLLVLRTAIAVLSGSTKIYFVQPIVTTTFIGALFLVSLAAGRPLIGRLAGDFCPLPGKVTELTEIRQHFRKLSFLWAGVYFMNAAVTLFLLLNLPVGTFVAAKTFSSLAITWCGIALTVNWSYRVAHKVGLLVRKPAAGGGEPAPGLGSAAPVAIAA
jgi:intracellular septation protein A